MPCAIASTEYFPERLDFWEICDLTDALQAAAVVGGGKVFQWWEKHSGVVLARNMAADRCSC